MKIPYLIQRGKARHNKFASEHDSLNDFINFDYMGSAEFEFGALPKSFWEMVDSIELIVRNKTKIKDNVIHYICLKADEEEFLKHFDKLIKGEYRTKEYTDMEKLYKKGSFDQDTEFWWDIKNNWIASTNKRLILNFLSRLKNLI